MACNCRGKNRAPKWQKPADHSKDSVAKPKEEEKTPQGEEQINNETEK